MIVVDRVTVRYDGCPAVDDVSMTIESGQWVALIGPNGAGKSSLMRAMLAQVAYDGAVRVDGVEVAGMQARERARRIAYVPQEPLLPGGMTAHEYVLLGRNPYVKRFATETSADHQIVSEILNQLDLALYARRPLGSLSGGERQRLVIARALAQQAPILLLDEPTSALDIGHQQQALELVDDLRRERGLTVVSAMHDLTLAGLFCDSLALMRLGRLSSVGAPSDVLVPDSLAEHYGVDVRVITHDDGTIAVVPSRKVQR